MSIIRTTEYRYQLGMVCELQTLDAFRRKVKWQYQLQWDSMRRTFTWYNNAWEAGVGSSDTGDIYSSTDKKVYESTSPLASTWFSIFMLGAKQRMGVARRHDKALKIYQLLLIGNIADNYWLKSNYEEENK